jgi:hypothetical protein
VSEPKIIIWRDLSSQKWIIAVEDAAATVEHEFIRDSEEVAIKAAKHLGAALRRPVYKCKDCGTAVLIQA